MTDDDYKQALREYARLVLKHRARRALIDLRRFRYRLGDSDTLGSWWANEIVPLYNQAGLEKFAFVLTEGEQVRQTKRLRMPKREAHFSPNNLARSKRRFPG